LTTIQDKEVLKFETTSTERPTAEHLTTIGSELIKNETVGKETISPTDYSTTASIISSTVPSDSTLISITESPILRNISIAEDLKKEDNISVSTQPTTVSKIDKLFDELTTESTFNMSSTEKFTTDESHISTQKSIDLSSTEAYVTNVSDISSTTLEEEGGWTYLRPINKTTSVKPNLTTVSPITEEYPIQNLTTKIVTIMSTTKAFEDESTLSPTTMSDKSIEDSSTKSVDRAETSAADDFVTLMSTTSKPLIRFVPVDISQTTSYSRESVTHSLPTRTTISTSSPSPSTLSSIKEFTTLSQTTSTAESKKTTPIPSTIASITTTGIYTEIEEGACVYDNKIYQSAEQIPRPHPCDFCFCFRGDIICLQQTCPPPIARCYEMQIEGFCCPRYECPVQVTTMNVTLTTPTSISTKQVEKKGCEINGNFYGIGEVVKPASGPCLECKCDHSGVMQCNPQACSPEAPLLLRMNRQFFDGSTKR
jgi:hypothetical protein